MTAPRSRRDDARPTSRGALVVAAVVTVVVGSIVPFGDLLLYPFTLFTTWVHEVGHGLAAIAVGGSFESLDVFADGSGLAHARYRGGETVQQAVVSLGGLLAPSIVGAAVLGTARGPRRAQAILVALAAALLVSLVLWVRSVAGLIAMPLVAAAILAFVWWGSPRERIFLAQFLGLTLALDTLGGGLDYLFVDSAMIGGVERPSDIAKVAGALGGPRILWSLVVSAVCIAFVAAGLLLAWRAPAGTRPR